MARPEQEHERRASPQSTSQNRERVDSYIKCAALFIALGAVGDDYVNIYFTDVLTT